MKIVNLAYYTINNFSEKSVGGISPMKLQKLLYYTKVWGIVSDNDVVEGEFEHWDYGPVNNSVYQSFKKYKNKPIPEKHEWDVEPEADEKGLIDFVLQCYVPYSAIELSKMTHVEEPWQSTHKNEIISPDKIKSYYSQKKFAKNFPIDSDKPFYPVETESHYAFIFDMDEDTQNEIYFSSFEDYLQTQESSDLENNVQQIIKELNKILHSFDPDNK